MWQQTMNNCATTGTFFLCGPLFKIGYWFKHISALELSMAQCSHSCIFIKISLYLSPFPFAIPLFHKYQLLFLSDGLRYATWDMPLAYSQLVFLFKCCCCYFRPEERPLGPNACISQMCQSGLVKGVIHFYKSCPIE